MKQIIPLIGLCALLKGVDASANDDKLAQYVLDPTKNEVIDNVREYHPNYAPNYEKSAKVVLSINDRIYQVRVEQGDKKWLEILHHKIGEQDPKDWIITQTIDGKQKYGEFGANISEKSKKETYDPDYMYDKFAKKNLGKKLHEDHSKSRNIILQFYESK